MSGIDRTLSEAAARFVDSLERLTIGPDGLPVQDGATRNAAIELLRLSRTLFPSTSEWSFEDDLDVVPDFRGAIVPVAAASAPRMMSELLQRTTLYANHTSFVLRASVHFEGDRLWETPLDVLPVLAHNHSLLPVLRVGRASVMPSLITTRLNENDQRRGRSAVRAPLDQGPSPSFLPLNQVSAPDARDVDLAVLGTFVLPYYPEIDLQRLTKIATEESDAFEVFLRWLTDRVRDLAAVEGETSLREVIAEIDAGVAELRLEAKKVASTRAMRNATIAGFAVSLGALLSGHGGDGIAGLTGAVSALELIRGETARRRDHLELQKSEFYVPLKAQPD